jgi:hypothetical protein
MRIVDRATFLTLPAGTLYAKVPADPSHYIFGELCIKGDSLSNDWYQQELVGWFTDCDDSGEWSDAFKQLRHGGERAVEFNLESRDGLFDRADMFAVFSRTDHINLIQRLITALGDTL